MNKRTVIYKKCPGIVVSYPGLACKALTGLHAMEMIIHPLFPPAQESCQVLPPRVEGYVPANAVPHRATLNAVKDMPMPHLSPKGVTGAGLRTREERRRANATVLVIGHLKAIRRLRRAYEVKGPTLLACGAGVLTPL